MSTPISERRTSWPGRQGDRRERARGTLRPARPGAASDVELRLVRERRALLDEDEAGFRLVAHEALDRVARVGPLVGLDHDLQERALPRIHGGFLELGRQHLAETLEAPDLDLAVPLERRLEELLLVGVVAGIDGL